MPYFPQYQNAVLVEYASFVTHSATSSSAATAASGDVHVYNSAATGWPLTLPAVGLGGPVKVVNIHATGTVVVSPNETSGVNVNGGASYTVPAGATGAAATSATFTSDGSANWYAS
jgi:hypothetical protein